MAPPMLPSPINPKRSKGATASSVLFIFAPIADAIPPAALLFPRELCRWHTLQRRYPDRPAPYPHVARPLACRRWRPPQCRRESFCAKEESLGRHSRGAQGYDRRSALGSPPSPCPPEERCP